MVWRSSRYLWQYTLIRPQRVIEERRRGIALLWANFGAMMMLGGVLLPMIVKEYPRIRTQYPHAWIAEAWKVAPWIIGFGAIYSGGVWLILLLR